MKLGEWVQVTNLLRKTDGAFRIATSVEKGSETAARGFLLLGEAQLAQKNHYDALEALNWSGSGGFFCVGLMRRAALTKRLCGKASG